MPMVSLQISEEILNKFDVIQRESGYLSRSEALRDAILLFIKVYDDRKQEKGLRKAIISVIYTPDIDTLDTISKIDYRFSNEIKIYSEYMIEKTIRVYILVGEVDRLNDLLEAFNKIKNTSTEMLFL